VFTLTNVLAKYSALSRATVAELNVWPNNSTHFAKLAQPMTAEHTVRSEGKGETRIGTRKKTKEHKQAMTTAMPAQEAFE